MKTIRTMLTMLSVALPMVACSAAPDGDVNAQSTSSASSTCTYPLLPSTVKAWDGTAVNGVVALVEYDSVNGDADWAVVDTTHGTIIEVLYVSFAQSTAFKAKVIDYSAGARCDGQTAVSRVSPCNPTGGGSGSHCGIVTPQATAPALPANADCIGSDLVTSIVPACVAHCVRATCDFDSCSTSPDYCGGTLSCGACARTLSCIANQCVNTHCAAGYRWCGVIDGCQKGSVCP